MKFGFLAHPVGTGQRNLVRSAGLVAALLGDRPGWPEPAGRRTHLPVPMLRTVTSRAGGRCTGDVRYLPYTAEELFREHETAVGVITDEARMLIEAGCKLVGLGGATSIVGDRGARVAEAVGAAFTSGNSLTAHATHATVRRVAELWERDAADLPVAVVGYPGSIGLAVTRLLLDDGHRVALVHRRGVSGRTGLLRHLDPVHHDRVTLHEEPGAAFDGVRLVVAASSTGGLVDPARLRPGTVVVDVALPRDVASAPRDRPDVLVLDGGLVSADAGALSVDGRSVAPTRLLNGCLAETLVLAMEERPETWSIGRTLDLARVREIGVMAARHGIRPAAPASFGRSVPAERIARLAAPAGTRSARPLTDRTADRFRRHVNPPMADLLRGHGIDRVFTRGQGCTLTTEDGVDYLDFVAGYGCLNLGHNPPAVVDRLHAFLAAGTPTFVQYVSMPTTTAALAERLCDLAPGRLDRAFFSNSGTEAVEAALKLARAATGRTRLVHVADSYHGKTLGALSVTGRAAHRAGFGPLLPDCVAVPFGDLPALAAAVEGAAAFIVEPVLGEGGVVLPPDGYLRAAQDLCRRAGAAFVVDEVQTGLGRTGALFASTHWDLEPDVLCLAKSLSGGLVPIGATLATAALWDAAYGSTGRAYTHSSTFGGGNFAAAAAMATLDVLLADDLIERAAAVGTKLRTDLAGIAARHSFVREVRGIGMMNAIAFDADLSGALGAAVDDVLTRLPGDLHEVVDLLPDDAVAALTAAGRAVETTLGDLLCLRVVRGLSREHRILTFVTANHNRVLRIQPPLVLEPAEADRFVAAFDAVARSLSFYSDLSARRPGGPDGDRGGNTR